MTPEDEARLVADIVALATTYGRCGYRRITALLRRWVVNAERVERIWRRKGLKVPKKQPMKGRLWLNDGSCLRLRPDRPNHVWAYNVGEDRTQNWHKYRMLTVVDEFTRESLAIRVDRRLNSAAVIETLADLMLERGTPGHIHADNGSEFVAKAVRDWILRSARRPPTSRPAPPGRTAMPRASKPSSATSCSTAKSSTR